MVATTSSSVNYDHQHHQHDHHHHHSHRRHSHDVDGLGDDKLSEHQHLLVLERQPHYAPQRNRWLVLVAYILLTSMQGLVWLTFSASPKEVKEYYNLGGEPDRQIDMLLNWGPISYVIAIAFVMIAVNRGGTSLWRVLLSGGLLTASGAVVRLIPTFIGAEFRQSTSAAYVLHFGQFLNGLNGPPGGATPSALSAAWFAPEQRTLATSLAYIPQVLIHRRSKGSGLFSLRREFRVHVEFRL